MAMLTGLMLVTPHPARSDTPICVAFIGAGGAIISAAIAAFARNGSTTVIIEESSESTQRDIFVHHEEPANLSNTSSAGIGINYESGYLVPSINVALISDVLRAAPEEGRVSFFVGRELTLKLDSSRLEARNCAELSFESLTLSTIDVPGTYAEAMIDIVALQGEEVAYQSRILVRQGEKPEISLSESGNVVTFLGGLSATDLVVPIPCSVAPDGSTELNIRLEFSGFGERR